MAFFTVNAEIEVDLPDECSDDDAATVVAEALSKDERIALFYWRNKKLLYER